jgi:23S rRNA pseudouridine2457 synthase
VLLLNKPFDVLCAFSDSTATARRTEARVTLADYVSVPDVYPAGRLDADSEGLLVLTNVGSLQTALSEPQKKARKVYWACVEAAAPVSDEQLQRLRTGVALSDGLTAPAEARLLSDAETAALWPRSQPIRSRLTVPTVWLELALTEGRNRQVRRMTAAVGLPTLRLVRVSIGGFNLLGEEGPTLQPGEWRELQPEEWTHLLPSRAQKQQQSDVA